MDKSAPEITFDVFGICNFCRQAEESLAQINRDKHNLPNILKKIKKDGENKKYDVLIGLSGGIDSSMVLHLAVKYGLRPLCFTVDNGWNTSVSDENILKMVEKLNVPFYRKTIDLARFKELQGAFLMAGVKNVEIPSDHMILATSLELANKYKIKWVLSGGNVVSESIMPPSWGYNARDLVHIKDIYKRYIGRDLSGLPLCGVWLWNKYKWINRINTVYLLDYINYNVKESKDILSKEYGWKDYGEKHEESVFTSWFQNYYLFEKFGIDKRKAHYSSLINSGQMTREEAIFKLTANPVYPFLNIEKKVMSYERHEHSQFEIDRWYNRISKFVNKCKSLGIIK